MVLLYHRCVFDLSIDQRFSSSEIAAPSNLVVFVLV